MKQHSPPSPIDDSDIAARLDRLPVTALHWAIVVLCALGLLFDVASGAMVMFAVVAAALVLSITLVLACGPRGLARRPVG